MGEMGRPRKNGTKEPSHLWRSLVIFNAYSKAREVGLKRSAAIRETVDAVRQRFPGMRISETEVKRVVAKFSPRGSSIALWVEDSPLEGDEAAIRRRRDAEFMEHAGIKRPVSMNDSELRKPLKRWTFGFHAKPNYPRNNAKKS
jgi:hypothetical protein